MVCAAVCAAVCASAWAAAWAAARAAWAAHLDQPGAVGVEDLPHAEQHLGRHVLERHAHLAAHHARELVEGDLARAVGVHLLEELEPAARARVGDHLGDLVVELLRDLSHHLVVGGRYLRQPLRGARRELGGQLHVDAGLGHCREAGAELRLLPRLLELFEQLARASAATGRAEGAKGCLGGGFGRRGRLVRSDRGLCAGSGGLRLRGCLRLHWRGGRFFGRRYSFDRRARSRFGVGRSRLGGRGRLRGSVSHLNGSEGRFVVPSAAVVCYKSWRLKL